MSSSKPPQLTLSISPYPPGKASPTSASSATFPLSEKVVRVTELKDLSVYDVIIDVRPYNNYSDAHIKGAINMCIPTTLLKRNSLDLLHLLNLVSIPPSTKDMLVAHISGAKPSRKITVLVYDSNSSEDHIALHLNQTISRFDPDLFNVHYLDGGFACTEAPDQMSPQKKKMDFPCKNCSSNIVEYSPKGDTEQTPVRNVFSGFKLPSQTNYKTKFVNSIKKNSLFDGPEILSQPHCDYRYTFSLPENLTFENIEEFKNLPKWLNFFVGSNNDKVVSNLVAKFTKIEKSEKLRLSCLVSNNKEERKNPLHLHSSSSFTPQEICSPIGQCPDCDEINYRIPRGIEYGFKNRYNNIWPYEHSRVKLQNKMEDDDYINANFIDPLLSSDFVYIATQNPLRETVDDFWQIVDSHEIKVIISLDNSPLLYLNKAGQTEVVLRTDSTVVRKINNSIYHFEFKIWPDFGVPQDFDAVMSLIQLKNNLFDNNLVPSKNNKILVHCSAGCGRTGVFIAIDSLINAFKTKRSQFMQENDDLVYKMIHNERKQRISMVQNLDQYIVCYEMLLYYLANTEKYKSDIPMVLCNLMVSSTQGKEYDRVMANNTAGVQSSNSFGDDYFSGLTTLNTNAVKSN